MLALGIVGPLMLALAIVEPPMLALAIVGPPHASPGYRWTPMLALAIRPSSDRKTQGW